MKSMVRIALVSTALFAPALAFAAFGQTITTFVSFGIGPYARTCATYIECVADTLIYLINGVLVPVLFAVAFIVFLYGVAKTYIFSIGDAEEVSKGHRLILWGIIGFAVMVSIWGLVNVVANTFGLAGSFAPLYPTSY